MHPAKAFGLLALAMGSLVVGANRKLLKHADWI
jgi:hypothetical protein